MKIESYLSQSPLYWTYLAQLQLLEPIQTQLKKQGVHLFQGLLLTAIFFEDREVRPTELVKAFKIKRSNLSHSLRSLETQGYVRRIPHPSDARGYLFSLTPPGRRKALSLIKFFDEIQTSFEQVFSSVFLKNIISNLKTLLESENERGRSK